MFSSVLALAVDIPNWVTENDHLVKNREVLSFLASHITETKALLADDRRVVGDVVRWESIWIFCTNPLGPMAEKLNLPVSFCPPGRLLLVGIYKLECSDMADSELTQLGNLYSKVESTYLRVLLLAVLCGRSSLVWSQKVKIKGNHL
jgi:hypothetical protein